MKINVQVDDFDEDRTQILRKDGYQTRNLGQMQMPTDTAAIVAKRILIDQVSFESLKFVDRPEIQWDEKERTIMDFRYLAQEDGQPLISEGVLEIIRRVDIELDFLQ